MAARYLTVYILMSSSCSSVEDDLGAAVETESMVQADQSTTNDSAPSCPACGAPRYWYAPGFALCRACGQRGPVTLHGAARQNRQQAASPGQPSKIVKYGAIFIVGFVVLCGIGGGIAAIVHAVNSHHSSSTATTTVNLDQRYLLSIRGAGVTKMSDSEAITLGHQVCGDLKSGTSVSKARQTAMATGQLTGDFTPDEGQAIVDFAIANYCPSYANAAFASS